MAVSLTDSWVCLGEEHTSSDTKGFLEAVNIWIRRPNVVYKRLFGALCREEGENKVQPTSSQSSTIIRELLPKSSEAITSYEKIIIDSTRKEVLFYPLHKIIDLTTPQSSPITLTTPQSTPTFNSDYQPCVALGYKLQFNTQRDIQSILLFVEDSHQVVPKDLLRPSNDWLKFVLLPKLSKWAAVEINNKHCETTPTLDTPALGTPIVPLEEYYLLYKQLKEKYASYLVQNWCESTDPYKFVYEDIAIATYLLVMWKNTEQCKDKKQSFIDLGCGNGLLVYLLSSEGHIGKGIDLRPRKIWKILQPIADLEVMSLTPSDATRFPEFDWLIGNHSDELTPWIPVISSRSSYSSKFFVLPCCTHDFDQKFQRPNSLKSQYQSYLDYITIIGEKMGFKMLRDSLNIPSSKRVCLVGHERTYSSIDESKVDQERKMFLDSRCQEKKVDSMNPCGPPSHSNHAHSHSLDSSPSHSPPSSPTHSSSVHTFLNDNGQNNCNKSDTPTLKQDIISNIPLQSPNEVLSLHSTMLNVSTATVTNAVWAESFTPRLSIEAVKNCTRVQHEVKDLIITMVTDALLKEVNLIELDDSDNGKTKWNRGGCIHLNEIIPLINRPVLLRLKSEHGGLQTLLRNHCQIFEVKGGCVSLRNWSRVKDSLQSDKYKKRAEWKRDEHGILYKTKLCWFNEHHPQGCPRLAEICPYAHGSKELRKRPDFTKVQ